MQSGLRLIVVDYLQIITPDDRKAPREQQVADMSKQLKWLSRELQVPVLVLAQLNREAEKGQPFSLKMLRESDAIGQNADVVLALDRGAVGTEDERKAALTIGKNRNGPVGKITLSWSPEITRFFCDTAQDSYGEFESFT